MGVEPKTWDELEAENQIHQCQCCDRFTFCWEVEFATPDLCKACSIWWTDLLDPSGECWVERQEPIPTEDHGPIRRFRWIWLNGQETEQEIEVIPARWPADIDAA